METAVAEAPVQAERPESKLLEVDPGKFAALSESRARVNDALVKFNVANEDAKAKKKIYEAARTAFERDFDRFVQNVNGEDLPLFANQSEAIERAKADPVVTKLVDRLLHNGHDVNALIVMGYTQDERAQASAYLDALEESAKSVVEGPEGTNGTIEVPPFLLPQPLTPVEVAELARRLETEEMPLSTDQIANLSKPQLAEARDWLDRCHAIRYAKGDDITFDDLPSAPEWIVNLSAQQDDQDAADDSDQNVH